MSDANNPWRDKYRRALAQQEQLEKSLNAQQGILHRAILNLSAAAEGYDKGLDERLDAIRVSVKNNDVSAFDRMLKSLPRVTEEVDKREQEQWKEINKSLANIADHIHKQSPDANVKPAVKHFKKQLPKDASPIPATFKRLLQQLIDLQQLALSVSPNKSSSSFLGKLFKDKEENITEDEQASLNENTEAEQVENVTTENDDISIEGEPVELETIEERFDRKRSLPESLLENISEDQLPKQVPDKVSVILIELLDHFKTVPAAKNKAQKARERIENGIRWFELAPTLEDIRDFVLQAYIGADQDYRDYLEHIYGELSEILEALGISIETEEKFRKAADHFHSSVNDEMNTIRQALNENEDINQLKSAVESHVHQLQLALNNYQQQSTLPNETDSLAIQLQTLVSKVQEMEQNEEEIRQRLEAEKKRALTDPLTGLANREAYGERVHQEFLRWQRYGHPLTLAVIDIDFFKKFNDTYGHQTGDKVLKIVANSVVKKLREVDFMARFGGEEFVILLPETTAPNALKTLDRIREALAKAPFRFKEEKVSITVSIGISEFKDNDTAEDVFARADEALYKAKEGGRNQCSCL
jgi:diguanylate cyclase